MLIMHGRNEPFQTTSEEAVLVHVLPNVDRGDYGESSMFTYSSDLYTAY